MKWTILSILCLIGYFGTQASQDADFEDVDALLHRYVRDYGGGGGPLAASGFTLPPKQGQKPSENKPTQKPKSAEKPTPAPTTKAAPTPAPTTKAPATPAPTKPTTKKADTQPPATEATRGPTAPTKAAKDIKSPGPDTTNGRSGEEIANDIYNHPNECKDPANGGVWAPLPKGQPCGADGNCPYPQKWCSAKQEGSSTSPSMSCQDLPPDCQKVLGGGGGEPTRGPDTTSSQAQTTASTAASTSKASQAATNKPTTPPPAGSTPPAGGSSPSPSNCKDNHPYCCFWADDKSGRPSQCDANSGWMKSQCAKSCGTCGCTSGNCPTKVNTAGCQFLPGGQGGGPGNKVRIVLGGAPGLGPFGGAGTGLGGIGNGLGNSGGFGGFPAGGQVPPGLTRINLG